MSIKSDLWIRRMAEQHKMIEPFEAGQVRYEDPPYTLQYPIGWTGMMLNDTPVPEQPIQFESVSALSKPVLW